MAFYEGRMKKLLENFNKSATVYEKLLPTPEEKKIYRAFRSKWEEYMQVHDKMFALAKQNKTQEAVAILTTRSRDIFNEITELLEKIINITIFHTSTSP